MERPRRDDRNWFASVLTHWETRLVVVLSMLVALSVEHHRDGRPGLGLGKQPVVRAQPGGQPGGAFGAPPSRTTRPRGKPCCSMATPTAQPRRGHGPGAALLGPRSAHDQPLGACITPPLPVSSTQITATTPVELAGTVDVTVGTPPARVPPALLTSSVTRRSPSSVLSAQCQGCRRGALR